MGKLKEFLLDKMNMTGPYQPVIIKFLLENSGKVDIEKIAIYLAANDKKSIQYYKDRLKVWPKQILKKHKIAELNRGIYEFKDDVSPDFKELKELQEICDSKINEYYSRDTSEDKSSSGWGLKRVTLIDKFPYCQLCGQRPSKNNDISLDIDHIKPKTKGGSDDLENLQVLCHQCNRAKGNSFLKSAEKSHEEYLKKEIDCLFCNIDEKRIVDQNDYIFVIRDGFPVTLGHTLIITKRHVSKANELTDAEVLYIFKQSQIEINKLESEDSSITGINLGFNIGVSAGQSVNHVHFHIIPRRNGDIENPRGGIRHVIPGKGNY
jgi:ATP adenylyltransferase